MIRSWIKGKFTYEEEFFNSVGVVKLQQHISSMEVSMVQHIISKPWFVGSMRILSDSRNVFNHEIYFRHKFFITVPGFKNFFEDSQSIQIEFLSDFLIFVKGVIVFCEIMLILNMIEIMKQC